MEVGVVCWYEYFFFVYKFGCYWEWEGLGKFLGCECGGLWGWRWSIGFFCFGVERGFGCFFWEGSVGRIFFVVK